MKIHALTYLQRRVDLFGPDAGDGLPELGHGLTICQRGGLFSGNSESSQSTTDARIGVESGMVTQSGGVAAQEGDATLVSGSNVSSGESVTATGSTVANQGSTLFQNVSGGLTIGVSGQDLLDLLSKQSEETSDTINLAVQGTGTNLANALDKLAETTAASQTGGASIITKQFAWLIVAVLAVVGLLLWKKA